jgi:hypothetical protein
MRDLLTGRPDLEVKGAQKKLSWSGVLRQVMLVRGCLCGKREELHEESSKRLNSNAF